MDRVTKQDVKCMFNRLCKAMKRLNGENYQELTLDYIACYGGYVIEQACENGGVSNPFGSIRRNAREMYLSMHMTAQALEDLAWEKQQGEMKGE